jgi:hypothetical protein
MILSRQDDWKSARAGPYLTRRRPPRVRDGGGVADFAPAPAGGASRNPPCPPSRGEAPHRFAAWNRFCDRREILTTGLGSGVCHVA